MRTIFLAAAVILSSTATVSMAQQPTPMAAPSQPYVPTATSSVDLMRTIPCDRVRRNTDGSWTIPGTVVMGGMRMTDDTFKGGQEQTILDGRCMPDTK